MRFSIIRFAVCTRRPSQLCVQCDIGRLREQAQGFCPRSAPRLPAENACAQRRVCPAWPSAALGDKLHRDTVAVPPPLFPASAAHPHPATPRAALPPHMGLPHAGRGLRRRRGPSAAVARRGKPGWALGPGAGPLGRASLSQGLRPRSVCNTARPYLPSSPGLLPLCVRARPLEEPGWWWPFLSLRLHFISFVSFNMSASIQGSIRRSIGDKPSDPIQ